MYYCTTHVNFPNDIQSWFSFIPMWTMSLTDCYKQFSIFYSYKVNSINKPTKKLKKLSFFGSIVYEAKVFFAFHCFTIVFELNVVLNMSEKKVWPFFRYIYLCVMLSTTVQYISQCGWRNFLFDSLHNSLFASRFSFIRVQNV